MLIDPIAYKNKVSLMSKKPRTTIIPNYVQKLIIEKALRDIKDENLRAQTFLKQMFIMKIRGSTIARHFKIIKPILFPNTTILPNSMAFDNQKSPQNKVPNLKNVDNLIEYIKSTKSKYKWPMLLALYTGLRLREVIQLKASHVIMLAKKQEIIPINRKNNNNWNVIYYDIFEDFVNHLRQITFKEECDFYLHSNVDSFVFQNISTSSLHIKIHEFYSLANGGRLPPTGFGMHIFRYYAAMKLVQSIKGSNGTKVAQMFLGHKNIKTTEIYTKVDLNSYTDRLKAINNSNSFYSKINKTLKQSSSSINRQILL